MSQDKIFLASESDGWFERNKSLIVQDERIDHALELLETYGIAPKKVLEVGAANGWRLERIATSNNKVICVGVEPSKKAVADGNRRYRGKVKMVRGTASDIPVKGKFDLVIVNFVFHWVPREKLFAAFSEIDRLVADDGFLIIGDFDPDAPERTAYHYLPKQEVFTYKQDYAKAFTESGLYREIARVTYDHDDHRFDPKTKANDRGFTALLRKSLSGKYTLGERGK